MTWPASGPRFETASVLVTVAAVPGVAAVVRVMPVGDHLAINGPTSKLLGLGDLLLGERRARRHDPAIGANVADAFPVVRVPARERDRALRPDNRLHVAAHQQDRK